MESLCVLGKNIFGLVVVLVFTADFFIPYATTEETISDYEAVHRGGRRDAASPISGCIHYLAITLKFITKWETRENIFCCP